MSTNLQNMNQFAQGKALGELDLRPNSNVYPAVIDPDSTFENFKAGTVLKLVAGASPAILVDAAEPEDEPFGVIPFNFKKNTYVAGDSVQVASDYCVLMLKSSEAIERKDAVQFDNGTTDDPTVAVLTDGSAQLGISLDQTASANQLIRVLVKPAAPVSS